jgi:hypothetical protein
MSTAFVTLSDATYFPKAIRTIQELMDAGEWKGDIVFIAVDFDPPPDQLQKNVIVFRTTHINTDRLVENFHKHPIRSLPDNRHFGKLYQWDKLQVFKSFFRHWERIVFLDAGLRVFNPVHPLLDLDWRGKFMAPDDCLPYDNGTRFACQLDLDANPDVTARIFTDFPREILDKHYFINCIFVFDTALLDKISYQEMETAMNTYPICMCNEMGIMNLIFNFKLGVWQPFPEKVGDKYLYGWCERNYRENPIWNAFHFVKYSVTA